MTVLFPQHFKLKSGQSLVIKEARPSDAAATIACLNQIGGETDYLTFGANQFNVSISREQEFIKWCRSNHNALMLLACVDEHLAGILTFEGYDHVRTHHAGELGISLLKIYWGQGIGTRLLQAAIDWARETGTIRKINLRVHEHNHRAIHLYQEFGFQQEGIISREYQVKNNFYANIFMGLWLE